MADPMTPERLAKIRERAESVKTWKGYHAEPVPQLLDVDVPALLDEVERLRAELAAIRTTETDVTWLADGVRRLILGVSVRTAKNPEGAQYTIAQEVASHINAGILTSFVSSRVVDLAVEHIKKAEAERDRARTVAASAEKTLGEQIDRAIAAEAERDRLAEQVKRAQDPDLIRRAIADPGAYVKRKRLDNGEPAETVPAWGARAVIAALGGTEAGR